MNREVESVVQEATEKGVNFEKIAEHLSVSHDTVRAWVKNRKLSVYCAGKR